MSSDRKLVVDNFGDLGVLLSDIERSLIETGDPFSGDDFELVQRVRSAIRFINSFEIIVTKPTSDDINREGYFS